MIVRGREDDPMPGEIVKLPSIPGRPANGFETEEGRVVVMTLMV